MLIKKVLLIIFVNIRESYVLDSFIYIAYAGSVITVVRQFYEFDRKLNH